ncbi:hypothetical protein BDV36DRAFT_279697 [Aspergillus pseudocaelatus]|uniref:General substrate transporter n=1 Tax=Aspergillus pseudocaelatus TaxID=1825620 RepID=A0ABQ6X0N0_9EURO|nr:hypothetical protein BDV36DRAFT_279697 [Aspergillus pseudocaelatus]
MDSKKEPYFGLKEAACATDMSLFGYDQGLFSGVVVAEDFLVVHNLIGRSRPRRPPLSLPSTMLGVSSAHRGLQPWERLGRKKSILLGTTLMAIGTLLKCVPYSLPQIFVGWVILGGKLVSLEMVMNILGLSMVNWINYGLSFAGGAVGGRFRNKGAAVATATNWITNFVIVEITPIRIQNIGWKFWIVWTVFNAAFLPAIYFVYPETANRTLEDIDAHYRSNPSLIVIKDPDAISAKPPLKYIEHEDHKMKMIGEVRTKKAGGLMVEHVE